MNNFELRRRIQILMTDERIQIGVKPGFLCIRYIYIIIYIKRERLYVYIYIYICLCII